MLDRVKKKKKKKTKNKKVCGELVQSDIGMSNGEKVARNLSSLRLCATLNWSPRERTYSGGETDHRTEKKSREKVYRLKKKISLEWGHTT